MKKIRIRIATILATILGSYPLQAELPQGYNQLNADEKQSVIWEKSLASQWNNNELPPWNLFGWASILINLRSLVSMNATFDHRSDELPVGRSKFIHTFGSVAKVSYVPQADHAYTGIFKSGAVGIARLSLAANPDFTDYTPGMAVKFFIDQDASVNLHIMNSLNGQGNNRNYFAKNFSNKIPDARGFLLSAGQALFELFQDPATFLSVSHLAKKEESGMIVDQPKAPNTIVLKPSDDVKDLISSESQIDLRIELRKIPIGATLYEVYDQNDMHIGSLVLESQLIPSRYGDKNLFFQHNR